MATATIEKYEVRTRWTNAPQFTAEISVTPDMHPSIKLGLAIKWAVKNNANLSGAYLSGANLRGANLSDANLRDANLRDADLSGAYLSGANLRGAYLSDANLSGANLRGAYLSGANLRGAYLSGANLSGAYLSGADLSGAYLSDANLRDANLSGADLRGADLRGADLRDAKDADLAIAGTRILPEGSLIGWKKCRNGVIVKLRIPEGAPRSHAFGRKCRAKFADVLEVIGADHGVSQHDGETTYRAGERVECDRWDENWQSECSGGIHFFTQRLEAEAY